MKEPFVRGPRSSTSQGTVDLDTTVRSSARVNHSQSMGKNFLISSTFITRRSRLPRRFGVRRSSHLSAFEEVQVFAHLSASNAIKSYFVITSSEVALMDVVTLNDAIICHAREELFDQGADRRIASVSGILRRIANLPRYHSRSTNIVPHARQRRCLNGSINVTNSLSDSSCTPQPSRGQERQAASVYGVFTPRAGRKSREQSPVAGSRSCPRRWCGSSRHGACARRGTRACSRSRPGSGWPPR